MTFHRFAFLAPQALQKSSSSSSSSLSDSCQGRSIVRRGIFDLLKFRGSEVLSLGLGGSSKHHTSVAHDRRQGSLRDPSL